MGLTSTGTSETGSAQTPDEFVPDKAENVDQLVREWSRLIERKEISEFFALRIDN